ncbi:MAG: hypothetical protein WCW67_00550 [Candidatus Margulisiibacteriota bacterium]|jgi:hypothetical protein
MAMPAITSLKPRPVSLIEQRSFNRPLTQEHRLTLPGSVHPNLPDLASLSPPTRLSSDLVDFNRHAEFLAACLSAAPGTLPILVTEQHVFSLPFYRALVKANPGEEIAIVSLDNHLDGVDITYTNWAFWGFGIYHNQVKPANLRIIGPGQQLRAEAFYQEYNCADAIPGFNYQVIEQYQDFIRQAAVKVVTANPTLDLAAIRKAPHLRDFAEYALLKNAGVTMSQSLANLDLAGRSIFVSFDTDVPLAPERLLAIAQLLRNARVLGVHISELHQGLPIHGREVIEEFTRIVVS